MHTIRGKFVMLAVIVLIGVLGFVIYPHLKKSSEPKPALRDDDTIVWEDAHFEQMVRKMFEEENRPITGDITVADLDSVQVLYIYGNEFITEVFPYQDEESIPDTYQRAEKKTYADLQYFRNLKSILIYDSEILTFQYWKNLPIVAIVFERCSLPDEKLPPYAQMMEFSMENCSVQNWDILSHNEKIKSLGISNMDADESMLKSLTQLTHLTIINGALTSLDCVLQNQNLMHLIVRDNRLKSLDGLEKLQSLELLYVSGNEIKDISCLQKLPNLKFLELTKQYVENPEILDTLTNCYIEDAERR